MLIFKTGFVSLPQTAVLSPLLFLLCCGKPIATTADGPSDALGWETDAAAEDRGDSTDAASTDSLHGDTGAASDTSMTPPDGGFWDTGSPDGWAPDSWAPDSWAPDNCAPDNWAPDTTGVHLEVPEIEGEVSAGHFRPSWRWTTPAYAVAFRWRIDQGSWQPVAVATTQVTAPADLSPGPHSFEVQAQTGSGEWSSAASFTTTIEFFAYNGYWDDVARDLPKTPHGHTCAISCHNCYVTHHITQAANLAATLQQVHAAQADGADMIELDLIENNGVIHVDHNDDGESNCALLSDVLDDPQLMAGNQVLFMEIKDEDPSPQFLHNLIGLFRERRAHYAKNGRPIVLRTFYQWIHNVEMARTELDTNDDNIFIENYIRLSVLLAPGQPSGYSQLQDFILNMPTSGYHMVELHYQDRNLFTSLALARETGLGTNLWTIPESSGEAFIAGLRQDTDVITTDCPISRAHSAVVDDNALFYVNTWDQTTGGSASTVPYFKTDATVSTFPVNTAGAPSLLNSALHQSLYGGYLRFQSNQQQSVALYDADSAPSEGVLVAAAVRFDSLSLSDGQTKCILNKSDSGGFALELHNPPGSTNTLLRFGVVVGNTYIYANYSASHLNTSDCFFIMGAYDSQGGIYLWINNRNDNVQNGSASGGIVGNDSPVRIGADPIGTDSAGYFFDGRVQMVVGQSWRNR